MKTLIVLEFLCLRFAKGIDLPFPPFIDLTLFLKVEEHHDIALVVKDVWCSPEIGVVKVYCRMMDDAYDSWAQEEGKKNPYHELVTALKNDSTWTQFGNYSDTDDFPDGPSSEQALKILSSFTTA